MAQLEQPVSSSSVPTGNIEMQEMSFIQVIPVPISDPIEEVKSRIRVLSQEHSRLYRKQLELNRQLKYLELEKRKYFKAETAKQLEIVAASIKQQVEDVRSVQAQESSEYQKLAELTRKRDNEISSSEKPMISEKGAQRQEELPSSPLIRSKKRVNVGEHQRDEQSPSPLIRSKKCENIEEFKRDEQPPSPLIRSKKCENVGEHLRYKQPPFPLIRSKKCENIDELKRDEQPLSPPISFRKYANAKHKNDEHPPSPLVKLKSCENEGKHRRGNESSTSPLSKSKAKHSSISPQKVQARTLSIFTSQKRNSHQ